MNRSKSELTNLIKQKAYDMGFTHAAVGAMVGSSYHADQQAEHALAKHST